MSEQFKIELFIIAASMITAVFYFKKAKESGVPRKRAFSYFILWVTSIAMANHERGHILLMLLLFLSAISAFTSGITPKEEE